MGPLPLCWGFLVLLVPGIHGQGYFSSLFRRNPQVESVLAGASQTLQQYESRKWGDCWSQAVLAVKDGCAQGSSDVTRSKLAVRMANCHFELSGLPTYRCTDAMTVEQCTKGMVTSDIAFNTYSLYHTHVVTICFYIESVVFQETMDERVDRLLSAARDAALLSGQIHDQFKTVQSNIQHVATSQEAARQEFTSLSSGMEALRGEETDRHRRITEDLEQMGTTARSTAETVLTVEGQQRRLLEEQRVFREETRVATADIHRDTLQTKAAVADASLAALEIATQQRTTKEELARVVDLHQRLHGHVGTLLESQHLALRRQQELADGQQKLTELSGRGFSAMNAHAAELHQNLGEMVATHRQLLDGHGAALSMLQQLQTHQRAAFETAEARLGHIVELTAHVERATRDQEGRLLAAYNHVAGGLERLEGLHRTVTGSLGSHRAAFYCAALLVLFSLSQLPSLQTSRFPALCLLTAGFALECWTPPSPALCWALRGALAVGEWLVLRHFAARPAPSQRLMHRLLRALQKFNQHTEQRAVPNPYFIADSGSDGDTDCGAEEEEEEDEGSEPELPGRDLYSLRSRGPPPPGRASAMLGSSSGSDDGGL